MASFLNRRSVLLSEDQRGELLNTFGTLNNDGLELKDLKEALDIVGLKLPQWQVRQIVEQLSSEKKPKLNLEDFQRLYVDLKSKDVALTFKTMVSKKDNLQTIGGMSEASSEGTTHSIRQEEQVAFSDWINSNLKNDLDLKHVLPLDSEGKNLYDKVKDGILLCKIINHSCSETIDERVLNKEKLTLYTKHENLTLALNSAQAIGCNIINIDAHDLSKGKPHLVLGLLWQIIRIGLFNQITLEHCPGLVQLVKPGEEMTDLMKLSPEQILVRWVNYHLERAGVNRRLTNFTTDVKDSEIYTHLLRQIAPPEADVTTDALIERNLLNRAETMLQQADKLGCRSFVTPGDVVEGVYKLNLAFVANLFNNHPALDQPEEPIEMVNLEEDREEKTYRNWMNSMGVRPYVNWIYSDLADGLVIFQLCDIIKPQIVEWTKVHKKFSKLKAFMEKLENCNYVVDICRQLKFSLVGIAGQDIAEGNGTFTLAILWQLMRAYTLTILTQLAKGRTLAEKDIVEWANNKLQEANKTSRIRSFQDSSLHTSLPVIDLIDAISPGSINYSQVLEGATDEDRMANAKYAISMARKIGARIYALPEDLTEGKHKMVMTIFACLMARDYVPEDTSANGA